MLISPCRYFCTYNKKCHQCIESINLLCAKYRRVIILFCLYRLGGILQECHCEPGSVCWAVLWSESIKKAAEAQVMPAHADVCTSWSPGFNCEDHWFDPCNINLSSLLKSRHKWWWWCSRVYRHGTLVLLFRGPLSGTEKKTFCHVGTVMSREEQQNGNNCIRCKVWHLKAGFPWISVFFLRNLNLCLVHVSDFSCKVLGFYWLNLGLFVVDKFQEKNATKTLWGCWPLCGLTLTKGHEKTTKWGILLYSLHWYIHWPKI